MTRIALRRRACNPHLSALFACACLVGTIPCLETGFAICSESDKELDCNLRQMAQFSMPQVLSIDPP